MAVFGTLRWSETRGEGTIRLHLDFDAADSVTKLDALQDWIADLRNAYDEILEAQINPLNPPPQKARKD